MHPLLYDAAVHIGAVIGAGGLFRKPENNKISVFAEDWIEK
jgi:hypothetical protein